MNKTQAGRVFTLAHFLRTRVPEDEFYIGAFGKCGTPACAMGWAAEIFDEMSWTYDDIPVLKGHEDNVREGWEQFFGFTISQAAFFAYPSAYLHWFSNNPKRIADLLDSWANEAGWEVVQ